MGLSEETLAVAKKYTNESISGISGTLAGKNCTIKSITSITGGNRITFEWTADDNTTRTQTMDVMNGTDGTNGDDGKGISSVAVNSSNHLIITYSDGTTSDAGLVEITAAVDSVNGKKGNVTITASDVNAYTKTEVDTALGNKADKATTLVGYGITDAYSKTEVDSALTNKADKATTIAGYGITNAYTKGEVDSALTNKADKATTLAGYGITDAYSKTEADSAITDKINELDAPDSAVAGKYVTAVNETNGKITVTKETADVAPTSSSTKMVTSGGVKTYVDEAIADLDVSDSAVSGSYVTAVSETDGAISVTREAADNTPTASSTKMVTSGGVKTALDDKVDLESNGVLGAKNLCPLKVADQTIRGITITTSDDGKYKVLNGTSTGNPVILSLLDEITPYPIDFTTYSGISKLSPEQLGIDVSKKYIFSRNSYDGVRFNLWLFNNDNSVVHDFELGTNSAINSIEIDFTSYTFDTIAIIAKVGLNNVLTNYAMKPMLCLKSWYDIDPTYQPYAKTNQFLTKETTALLDNLEVNGAVNMLPSDIATQVFKGATITRNSNGSYSVVKSTADSQSGSILSTAFTLKAGTYYWSASQDGDSAIGSSDCYCFIKGINGTVDWYRSTDDDVRHKWGVITLTQDSSIQFGIVVGTGTSNFTFYPMITVASYNGDYVPYAKSNKELTEDVAELVSDLTPLANTIDITNVVQWNTYYTDDVSPEDYSALTTQQATDIAQGLYDLMKKLFGTTSIGCRIIHVDRLNRDSSGTQIGHSQGLAFIQMVQSYNTMLSDNDSARFSIMFLPYGVPGFYSFGCWGKTLRVNNSRQSANYADEHGGFTYDTISSYKG